MKILATILLICVVYTQANSLEEEQGSWIRCPKNVGPLPIYLPNPRNCKQFFECVGTRPVLLNCPKGLHFNPRAKVCDYPYRAGCRSRIDNLLLVENDSSSLLEDAGVEGNIGPTLGTKCPRVDGRYPTFLVDKRNCSRYYECSNGHPWLFSCPAGLHFNRRLLTCDLPSRAGCRSRLEASLLVEDDEVQGNYGPDLADKCPTIDGRYPTFLVDKRNCSRYYECSHGVPWLHFCPSGLHFNRRLLTCDLPSRAGCRSRLEASLLIEDAEVQGNYGPDLADKCPALDGRYPTFLVDKRNCSRYYECSHGVPWLHVCPPGLHFNRRLLTCDLPSRAGCSS